MPNQGREVLIPIGLLSHYMIKPWQKTIKGYGEVLKLEEREVYSLEINALQKSPDELYLSEEQEQKLLKYVQEKPTEELVRILHFTNDKIIRLTKIYDRSNSEKIFRNIQKLRDLVIIIREEFEYRKKNPYQGKGWVQILKEKVYGSEPLKRRRTATIKDQKEILYEFFEELKKKNIQKPKSQEIKQKYDQIIKNTRILIHNTQQ